MARKPRGLARFGPVAGALVVIVLIGSAAWYAISRATGVSAPEPPKVQQISVVLPPPPPPPPPDVEPPPQPKTEEIKTPEPEPEPEQQAETNEPPPGEDLGLDAEGGAGSDGFGLRARKGGRSLIGGGDVNKWYAGLVQRDLQAALASIDAIRTGRYSVVLNIWLGPDGAIAQSELVRGSGNPAIDRALTSALAAGVKVSKEPPADLPQPIKLRITSRT